MFYQNEIKIWPVYQIGRENYFNVSKQLIGIKVCLHPLPFMYRTPSRRRKIMTLYNFLSLVVRHKCLVLYLASLSPLRSAIHSHKLLRLLRCFSCSSCIHDISWVLNSLSPHSSLCIPEMSTSDFNYRFYFSLRFL